MFSLQQLTNRGHSNTGFRARYKYIANISKGLEDWHFMYLKSVLPRLLLAIAFKAEGSEMKF
jgi:hypothetical protein